MVLLEHTDPELRGLRSRSKPHAGTKRKAGIRTGKTGAENPNAKLRDQEVREIKRCLRQGVSRQLLADVYNVSFSTIWQIGQGMKWRHIR